MELYILSKQDLSILSICKLADYQINLDEETNAKSTFTLMKTNGLKKENYMVLNGLYRQFIFVIDDVQTEKGSNVVTVTALDISNIFDRKVIEKNIDIMKSKSIEEFLANTISEDFVNSDDTALNVNYIEIYWHTNTQGNVATNAENGLYNFHTFLINCRQYKNIYTDFKLENLGNPQTVEGKRISVEAKNRKIVDISLHGESTQNGTPTPDNPIEIENVEGNIEFKVEGKNRFDKEASYIFKTNNVDKIVLDTGVRIQSTATYTTNATNFYVVKLGNITDYLGKTIRIKTTALLSSDTLKAMFYLGTCTDDGTSRKSMKTGTLAKGVSGEIFVSTTISSEQGDMYDNLMIALYSTGGTPISSGDYIDYNQLIVTADDEDMTYEPYKSQIAYFPLAEGQKLMEGSYLADDGIHHTRKQFEIDVTQIRAVTSYNNIDYASIPKPADFIGYNNYAYYEILCNKAISQKITLWDNTENINKILSQAEKTKFYLGFEKGTTLEQMKTALANTVIEYELAEPETVPYTEEQQETWNKIKNLTLFEGVNHISSDANMVLKYYPLEPVGLKFVLRIDIENKQETTELIDTTLPEVTDYNKIYEEDFTAKVQVYIREDGSEYNLYLKTDRTTTTNKDDPDRASGKIEVISVETADRAPEEALNVMKGNNYKHLVEFKIAKTSKLMDITELHIGRPIRIKTDDDIYDSYISAITLSDENFVYFKSGSLRITLLDKLKKTSNASGDKLDRTGGKITGNLDISGTLKENGKTLLDLTYPVGSIYMSINSSNPSILFGRNMGSLGKW